MPTVITSPRDILLGAYGRSSQNIGGVIAEEDTELLELVIRVVRAMYSIAAELHPYFYAVKTTVSYDAGLTGWERPDDVELLWRVQTNTNTIPAPSGPVPAGSEVVVVPYDDRKAETGLPALYEWGQILYGAGNVLDPTGGDLDFFYSKIPTDPSNLDDTLDDLWSEQYNELLMLEVAIYLAMKDGRNEEMQGLIAERDRWLALFLRYLKHSTANLRRRYGDVTVITGQQVVAVGNLLAGGTKLDLGGV